MRNFVAGAAVCGALWALPAAAVNTESYKVPYFAGAPSVLQPDSVRKSDLGMGYQIMVGVPFDSKNSAVEIRFFDYAIKRSDGKKNFQSGLFGDFVYDFGAFGGGREGFFAGIKPFLNIGIGFVEEDVFAEKHLHFGADAGGGFLFPLGWRGVALRLDGRAQAQANNESCNKAVVSKGGCSGEASFLVDYQGQLWVQIPMTVFFDRPVPPRPVRECPIAVVDPITGRRDCASDSDRDGVADPNDRCPGTPSGSAVNKDGCVEAKPVEDADGDSVKDTADRCPGTHPGMKVNAEGCVVAQTFALRGINFQMDSDKLTPDSRETLDSAVQTLLSQRNLQVEVAGHTDNVGSEAYNMLLSQQRAESVRAYLVEKGVEEKRLTAVGYGELEPVTGNDTEDQRDQNRRVEFRITSADASPAAPAPAPAAAPSEAPAPAAPPPQ
jgi:outer membrane protein OmpA-like peptidoglycan-associated protein